MVMQKKGIDEAHPMRCLLDINRKVVREQFSRTKEENNFNLCYVGGGCQDWDSILEASIKSGAKYFIVEQDNHNEYTSFEDMIKSIEFLKTKF